ncbi:hypothetical protein [Devosia sediminis]|uniref:Uncharacterized protein n=1 Tax=Devosia sediminis TaxID=2798801 RepID=A0A934MLZ4_9HYPH|nr:hypothetical protein [Devosia sediminis]MBJ3785161.1 hypothetical protein [Devosia sediminis]
MPNHVTVFAILAAALVFTDAAEGKSASRLDLSEWVGEWSASDEQMLTVSLPEKKTLLFEGYATYGANDPDRVASGGVNMGEFSVRVPSSWITDDNEIAFAVGSEGEAIPVDEAEEYDCVIEMRLDWNINWIDVVDNRMCGGLNVSFTGQYEWVVE